MREFEFIWLTFSWQKKPKFLLKSQPINQRFPHDKWLECHLGIMWVSCLPPSESCDMGFNLHCVQALKTWRTGVVGTLCACRPNMRWDESNGHTSGEMLYLRSDKKGTHRKVVQPVKTLIIILCQSSPTINIISPSGAMGNFMLIFCSPGYTKSSVHQQPLSVSRSSCILLIVIEVNKEETTSSSHRPLCTLPLNPLYAGVVRINCKILRYAQLPNCGRINLSKWKKNAAWYLWTLLLLKLQFFLMLLPTKMISGHFCILGWKTDCQEAKRPPSRKLKK